MKRKLNLHETDPLTENKDESTASGQISNSSKDENKQKDAALAEKSNDKKQQETEMPENAKSTTQGNSSKVDGKNDKDKKNSENKSDKKEENQQPYNLRSMAQGKESQNMNSNTTQTAKNTANANSTTENKGNTSKSITTSKKTEFSEVFFHIIVSPTYLHDPKKGDVYVQFQASTLGGWDSRKNKLVFKSCQRKIEKDKNKGMIKTIKGWFGADDFKKELKKEAAFSFRAMAPQVQLSFADTNCVTGEDILYHIDSLLEGIQTSYQVSAGLWYSGREYVAYMTKEIHDFVTELLKKLYEKKNAEVVEDDKIFHLSAAVAMICIKDSFGIQLTDSEEDKLCRALLPVLNDKNSVQNLKETDSLLKVVKQLAGDSSQSCWFYCVPLLHYLYDKYKPYQEATQKVNHEETVPEWWGIAEFKDQHGYFKGKSRWDRKKNEVLQSLSPYFEFDYLLPRTFVASLHLNHITDSINLELLPTDATMAALCYHVKVTHYLSKEMIVGLKKTFARISSMILENAKNSALTIEYPLRNFKIASNVLDHLYAKYVDDKALFCISAVEVLFISVAWFANILKVRQAEGKNGTYRDHLVCYEKHRDRIKYIMSNELYHGYEEQFLKIWNASLNLKIQEGEIRESLIKYYRDELDYQLRTRSPGAEVRLIELYCENAETYCDSVQEILSKLAFSKYGFAADDKSAQNTRLYVELGSIFHACVKFFYHEEYSKSLSSASSDLMSNLLELLKQMSEALGKGNYFSNTRELELRIKRFEKLEDVSLNLLCQIAMLDETKHPDEYQPTVTAFGLDEHVVQTIPHILKCGQGLLFITLWDKRGNELAKQKKVFRFG
ncbi:unnamed protein product [Mytilus edulis]|uniref:Uncharacterized protein n=1 Tax=Mytilus edulis TaxID=6550 RepID=A0A8S3RC80_MYTED|nr:unnamed protein product [Mytilus edulis]